MRQQDGYAKVGPYVAIIVGTAVAGLSIGSLIEGFRNRSDTEGAGLMLGLGLGIATLGVVRRAAPPLNPRTVVGMWWTAVVLSLPLILLAAPLRITTCSITTINGGAPTQSCDTSLSTPSLVLLGLWVAGLATAIWRTARAREETQTPVDRVV